jgi:predicted glutamine amidotransferase
MCRFAVSFSRLPTSIADFLSNFAEVAEKNPAPDGDKQEDGWGVAYRRGEKWKNHKSTLPIWQQKSVFDQFPSTRKIAVHARSASFSWQKNMISANQPYHQDGLLFVFNGMIKKIKLSLVPPLEGEVGAKKIFSLLLRLKKSFGDEKKAIEKTFYLIKKNSEQIYGFNLALVGENKFYVFSYYTCFPDYYRLWYLKEKQKIVVASNPLTIAKKWEKLRKGKVYEFSLK